MEKYPLPLPSETARAFWTYYAASPSDQNPGLIFERFMPKWADKADTLKEQGLQTTLQASTHASRRLLQAWNARWAQLAVAIHAQTFTLQTDWRLIAGLGKKGSLEVGFTFHRYGFPYLPGSSLKGLARTAGLLVIGQEIGIAALNNLRERVLSEEEREKIGLLGVLDKILGREKDDTYEAEIALCQSTSEVKEMADAFRAIFGTQERAGKVIFLDAIPSAQALPRLEMDIMNPHYPDYYKETGDTTPQTPPANWQSPIPVKFLTVASGVVFRFGVAWRYASDDAGEESEYHRPIWNWFKQTDSPDEHVPRSLRLARSWLENGLIHLGVGGKTNTGYGYFAAVHSAKSTQTPSEEERPSLPPGYERGTVSRFGLGTHQSYGFIMSDKGQKVFVHKSALRAGTLTLQEEQHVVFKVVRGPKGLQAKDVFVEEE